MRVSASGDIHPAIPPFQYFNCQMRGGAESEQAHAFSMLDSCHAQAAESDDARAEQRRSMKIVERCRQRKYKIRARQCVLGVAAVYRVPGESRIVTQVLLTMLAIPATTVDAANPRNPDARTGRQLRRRAVHNFAHDLVPGNHTLQTCR